MAEIPYHRHGTFQVAGEFEATSKVFLGPTPQDAHPELAVALTVRNAGDAPIPFTFNSTQRFEIELVDDAGDVVTRWSTGKVFGDAVSTEQLAPHTSWRFCGQLPLPNGNSGQYIARIFVSADLRPGAQSPLRLQFGP